MSNFVQSTKYDVHMYAKSRYLSIYSFFVIKYFKIWFIAIFYKELILKTGFGQVYGKDLVQSILKKFILYFS
jgi:hypothetical protein